MPKTAGSFMPKNDTITTMPWAVKVYERIRRRQAKAKVEYWKRLE
jgi:hypothetical protein